MKQTKFVGKVRKDIGKGPARKARREGFLPGVLYGAGFEPIPIKVERKNAEQILRRTEAANFMTDLALEKENGNGEENIRVMLRECQTNAVTGKVLHLDFYRIQMDKPVTMEIPVHLVGDSVGLEKGGIIEQELREIRVEALPADIPEVIDVDISGLDIGESIFVKDVKVSESVRILEDEKRVVVVIHAPKVAEEEAEKEEGVEEGEGQIEKETGAVTGPEVIAEEKTEERRKEKEAGSDKKK